MTDDSSKVLRLRDGELLWSDVGDEIVVLDQRRSFYLGVNPTGGALWDLLVAGCRQEQLVARLVETFGIEAEQAEADTSRFVESLRSEGLLAQDI